MGHINIEIKARTESPEKVRKILLKRNAEYKGLDHQVDTYFNIPLGRLKLREGNIENHLIYYSRPNQEGPKQSDVILFDNSPGSPLKELLTASLRILVVVDKKREIYFIDNVKFHIDTVRDLGTFAEIEAIDLNGNLGRERLLQQCQEYQKILQIKPEDLISVSYSDMLLNSHK